VLIIGSPVRVRLSEVNISYVLPAHSKIIHLFERKATEMFSEIVKPQ